MGHRSLWLAELALGAVVASSSVACTDQGPRSNETASGRPLARALDSDALNRQAVRRSLLQLKQGQAAHDPAYALLTIGDDASSGWQAHNPAQRFALSFTSAGAALSANTGWNLGMTASAVRCDERRRELGEARLSSESNRVG